MLDVEKVLFDGVRSADPPISSGISFTKKSKHTLEAFLVAIEELFELHSSKNSLKIVSKLFGASPLILRCNSDASLGYFSI